MRRRQLIEIHEQPWCPSSLRDAVTDTVAFYTSVGQPFEVIADQLTEVIRKSGATQVVDLCSGAGGPWLDLVNRLEGGGVEVVLTDLHPNEAAFDRARARSNRLVPYPRPVDARGVPDELRGLRTLFTSFHHFRPEEARGVVADAISRGAGIAIFEAQERRPSAILFFLLYIPLTFLAVPLIRPFRWSRLLWTYVVPALPVVVTVDAIISCLRTYEPEELRQLAEGLGVDALAGRVKVPWLPLRVTFLFAL